jgi:hypothetical protein
MAHVTSYSQEDEDGIFLYSHGKRIGGPYRTEAEATAASKAASGLLGEKPIEDYIAYFGQGLMPKEEANLFNTGFGEFLQETYRYGNPPPTLKLGMLKHPDAGHVVDMGTPQPKRPDLGWEMRGLAGHSDLGSAIAEVIETTGHDSPREYYDYQKKRGNLREGLSFEDWMKTDKSLKADEPFVAGVAQGQEPLRPTMWSHEFAHLGQFATPESGSGKEARQRMRDIMYPSLRHPEEIESDLEWLEDEGYEIGGEDWMQLYENTKLEDEYANEQLRLMGKTPGGTPNLQVLEDWLEGGRTKEGYKEVILRRRRENLPGLMGMWYKTMGLFDAN